MYRKLKKYLKGFPLVVLLHRLITRANWWLRDVRSAYLAHSIDLQITPHGFKLTGTNSIHHVAMQKGTFEPEETMLFKDIFQRTDVFVDVGANIGYYSCLARSSALHVIAVEPLAKNLEYLYANFLANNWTDVEVVPVGLGELPGLATLYGGSSTGASLIRSWAGASQKFRQVIPLSTLDILLGDRFSGKRVFIKIDVEGAEYRALRGATRVMDMRPKPTWVVEICLNEYHPDGVNSHFQDTFNLFWTHGYEVRTADGRDRLIRQADVEMWSRLGRCESGTINYRFVPLN
jgi:FkbM family methyltransferase